MAILPGQIALLASSVINLTSYKVWHMIYLMIITRVQINLFDTMEWKEGPTLPVGMKNAQAVIFENKLYVGGGPTRSLAGKGDHDAYLFIYDYADPGCATKKWTKMNTPVSRFGIAVYRSQLILVGGQMKDSANFTNRLWTMACTQWAEELPSMEFRRCHPCCVAHERCILVVGGEAEVDSPVQSVDIVVELYNGEQWTSIQPLPNEAEDICLCMKSVVIDRNVYLMGGEGRDETVYVAHLDSIINSTPDQESPWKALPNIPDSSAPMVLGNLLIAVGGSLKPSGEIHVYSPGANSWKTTEEVLPKPVRDTCATILPTGELMVIGGLVKRGVYTDAVFIGTPKGNLGLPYTFYEHATRSMTFPLYIVHYNNKWIAMACLYYILQYYNNYCTHYH